MSVTLDGGVCSRFCFGMGTMWVSFHDWGEHEAINDSNKIQIKASLKALFQMADMRMVAVIIISLGGRVLNGLSG